MNQFLDSPRYAFGIIGGLGPSVNGRFEQCLVEAAFRRGCRADQDFPSWILLSATHLPDRSTALLTGSTEQFSRFFEKEVQIFAQLNLPFFVVLCHTAHATYSPADSELPVPWLSLPRVVLKDLLESGISNPGLLSTAGTLHSGLYQLLCAQSGLHLRVFERETTFALLLHELITHPVWGLKATAGVPTDRAIRVFRQCATELLASGAESVILGCTELSVFRDHPQLSDIPVIDPLVSLAHASIDAALGWKRNSSECVTKSFQKDLFHLSLPRVALREM